MNQLDLGASFLNLVEHDSGWRQDFEQARSMVFDAAAGRITAIEHVGSTAVPGLPARPIVDLAARIEGVDLHETRDLLLGLNYGQSPWQPPVPGLELLQRPRRGAAALTHQVFLITDEVGWALLLAVRDSLRASPCVREAFAAEKARIAGLVGEDVERYAQLKGALFDDLLARIAS